MLVKDVHSVLSLKANISARTVRANIESHYLSASEDIRAAGRIWYDEGTKHCETIAEMHGVTVESVAAAMAQLSPQTRWNLNLQATYDLFQGFKTNGMIGGNYDRALIAVQSANPIDTINGKKTNAFARNFMGDINAVTVDIHATRLALGQRSKRESERIIGLVGVYPAIAQCYRLVALKHGETPRDMQAITWIVQRGGNAN